MEAAYQEHDSAAKAVRKMTAELFKDSVTNNLNDLSGRVCDIFRRDKCRAFKAAELKIVFRLK